MKMINKIYKLLVQIFNPFSAMCFSARIKHKKLFTVLINSVNTTIGQYLSRGHTNRFRWTVQDLEVFLV